MIFQFSDGEFSGPIATSLKMWEKINSFIVIIVIITFSVTLEKLNRNPHDAWVFSKWQYLFPVFLGHPRWPFVVPSLLTVAFKSSDLRTRQVIKSPNHGQTCYASNQPPLPGLPPAV